MSKRLISYDPFTRTQTWHIYDASTDTTHVETVQDVQPHLEYNKKLQNTVGYAERGRKMAHYHFAHIPNSAIIKLKNEKGLDVYNRDDLKKIEILLQRDPEWRLLRTY